MKQNPSVFCDENTNQMPFAITAKEIEMESNVEVRRVMIERMGYERYTLESGPLQDRMGYET